MLKQTIELHRQGNLDAAAAGYASFLAEHPRDSEALRLFGALRFQQGDRAAALDLLERAHQAAPELAAPLLTLGRVHLESRELDQARDSFVRALALDPNQSYAHTSLGQIALMQGDAKLAEQYFRTALRAGDDAQALSGLSMIAADANDAVQALKFATQAAELQPQDAMIQFALGRAFHLNGNHAFAEQGFNNALALRPNFHQAQYALGLVMMDLGRPVEAEQHFTRLHSAPGFEQVADVGLADALRAQQRFEEAIPLYQAALVAAPEWDPLTDALMHCLSQLGRVEEALYVLDRRIEVGGSSEAMWRNRRIVLCTRLARYDVAIQDNEWLLAQEPDQLQYRENLGFLHDSKGDQAAAEPHVAAVLAAMPNNTEMNLVRVRAALRNGDADSASRHLDLIASDTLGNGQRNLIENYRGQIADLRADYVAAVAHFSAAQRGSTSFRPALADVPESVDHWLDVPAGPAWDGAPVLLIGTPGSGVERIAALLADQPQLLVPRDRVSDRDRRDLFGMPPFDRLDGDISADEVAQAQADYAAMSQTLGLQAGQLQIDWLPRWDARLLALLHRVMPGTRIIVADRDARASLVDWLAFGWLPSFALDDLDSASNWLGRAQTHIRYGVQRGGPEHLVVDAAAIAADPATAGKQLAAFLGLEQLVPGEQFARSEKALNGMPARFADGHWRHYETALADTFARLND